MKSDCQHHHCTVQSHPVNMLLPLRPAPCPRGVADGAHVLVVRVHRRALLAQFVRHRWQLRRELQRVVVPVGLRADHALQIPTNKLHLSLDKKREAPFDRSQTIAGRTPSPSPCCPRSPVCLPPCRPQTRPARLRHPQSPASRSDTQFIELSIAANATSH